MSLRPKTINYNEYWSRLSDVALNVLRCENVSKLQWNSSFSDVYEVCVAKRDGAEVYAELLYMDTFILIEKHIEEIQSELIDIDINDFLPVYVKKWEILYKGLEYLHSLYSYVNTQHVKNRRPTESDICYSQAVINVSENNMEIKEMGLELWKDTVLKIGDKLKRSILREIDWDRRSERSSNFDNIQEAISSLLIVGNTIVSSLSKIYPYENLFENDLLLETMKFYQLWAADKSSNLSCGEYVIQAIELRKKEEERCRLCYMESMKKISDYFREIIVSSQLEFLNSSVKNIIDNESRNDLRNMFVLLSPYDLCTEMRNRLYVHTVEAVRNAIASVYANITNAHQQFVVELTKTRDRFYNFNREIFDEDSQFRNVIDKAFNKAINEKHQIPSLITKTVPHANAGSCGSGTSAATSKTVVAAPQLTTMTTTTITDFSSAFDPNDSCATENFSSNSASAKIPKPAELLNRYVDNLLRKQAKTMNDQEFEKAISNFIILFKYIEDKDAFQKYYQRSLCKRLIYGGTNLMMDNEENVINQIKSVCGLEYTSLFQRMFNDIQLISQLNKTFSDYLIQNPDIVMPCSSVFMVLKSCSWPISSIAMEFTLNPDLSNCFSMFYKFYLQKYQGRELKLTNQFSTVELQLCYTSKPYYLTIGTLQATILLFLDILDSDEITTSILKRDLTITNDVELEKALLSLTENKLLNKIVGPDEDDTYCLNRNFVSKRSKFRLLLSSKDKESATITEHETVDRQINDDRKFFIQAAIVRIMKSRKQLSHTMLMKEVLDQAKGRFLPAISMIRKCIEILIDKCYMERNPDNNDIYSYLA